jgi:hypothetical protein
MDWIALTQDSKSVEDPCGHADEPSSSITCWGILSIYTTGSFSRRVQLHRVSLVFTSATGFKNYFSNNPERLWHLTLHPVGF